MSHYVTRYGTDATYGGNTYHVVLEIQISSEDPSFGFVVSARQHVRVSKGNFGGKKVFCSWLSSTEGVALNGVEDYAWGAWKDVGTFESGESTTVTASAGMTIAGKYINSYVSDTYTCPYKENYEPINIVATRVNDKQAKISFQCRPTKWGNYQYVKIYRKTDTSSNYVQIAKIKYTSDLSSYIDKSISANHYYQYKVASVNGYGEAKSVASSVVETTPAKITNLKGIYLANVTDTKLTWNSTAKRVKWYHVQKADNASFNNPTTICTTLTSYTDTNPPSPNAYYRVRVEAEGGLFSAWSSGIKVETLKKPNAPSITSPATGAIYKMPSSVRMKWKHNSADGTEQTGAKIAYSTDGSTYTEVTSTTPDENYYDLNTSTAEAGTKYYVKVRTKGNHPDYSNYSNVATFVIADAPEVVINAPEDDGTVITAFPIVVNYESVVESGSISKTVVQLGSCKKTVYNQESGVVTFYASDVTLKNHKTHTITVTSTSSYKLSGKATRSIKIDFDDPMPPVIEVTKNEESFCADILVHFDTGYRHICDGTEVVGKLYRFNSSMKPLDFIMPDYKKGDVIYYSNFKTGLFLNQERIPTTRSNGFQNNTLYLLSGMGHFSGNTFVLDSDKASFSGNTLVIEGATDMSFESCATTKYVSIVRECNGEEELVAENIDNGTVVTDPIPPLNVDFTYKVISITEAGATNYFPEDVYLNDEGWFIWNFDDGYYTFAKLRYNPSDTRAIENNSTSVLFEGDEAPTCFGGSATVYDLSYSGTAYTREERNNILLELGNWRGKRTIYRTPFSEVIPVRISSISSSNTENHELFDIAVNQERVL